MILIFFRFPCRTLPGRSLPSGLPPKSTSCYSFFFISIFSWIEQLFCASASVTARLRRTFAMRVNSLPVWIGMWSNRKIASIGRQSKPTSEEVH